MATNLATQGPYIAELDLSQIIIVSGNFGPPPSSSQRIIPPPPSGAELFLRGIAALTSQNNFTREL